MVAYHDTEWGVPVHDDPTHFEFLVLEGAQAGLSWSTILKRRAGYRKAFAGFDPAKVARFTPARVEKLLTDPGIIRNRAKVEATVRNARAFLAVQEEFGSFDAYIWGFVGGRPIVNKWRRIGAAAADLGASPRRSARTCAGAASASSARPSATPTCRRPGLVNDHLVGCFRYAELTGPDGRRHQDAGAEARHHRLFGRQPVGDQPVVGRTRPRRSPRTRRTGRSRPRRGRSRG